MFQDAPIYQQLIKERGDVPSQVRREAERLVGDLSRLIGPLQAPAHAHPAAPQGQVGMPRSPALPPGRPYN